MPKALDIAGKRFGRLIAIERVGNIHGRVSWRCKCDCGNYTNVTVSSLRSGNTQSCGCIHREQLIARNSSKATSRKTNKRLYNVWRHMKERCEKSYSKDYKRYGARGICVCDEWQDFDSFLAWAISHGYDSDAPYGQCTIDRIDVNGNYEPANCRWVDIKTQDNNRRPRTVKRDCKGRYVRG